MGLARLIITDTQLQRLVQLNRSPHCTSGHEDRVTPHHFYGTRVAEIVSACVNTPAWLDAWLGRLSNS